MDRFSVMAGLVIPMERQNRCQRTAPRAPGYADMQRKSDQPQCDLRHRRRSARPRSGLIFNILAGRRRRKGSAPADAAKAFGGNTMKSWIVATAAAVAVATAGPAVAQQPIVIK